MSEEEAAAHRAPETIVQTTAAGEGRDRSRSLPSRHSRSGASFCAANSAVFCDRSARRAADSRQFSPRGLLWLFLRKKEQETLRVEACGAHAQNSRPPRAEASARAAPSAATSRSLKCTAVFLRTFGLTQKYRKVKHGERRGCRRRRSLSGHERLRLSHTRSGRLHRRRHFLRAFRSAVVRRPEACEKGTDSDTRISLFEGLCDLVSCIPRQAGASKGRRATAFGNEKPRERAVPAAETGSGGCKGRDRRYFLK